MRFITFVLRSLVGAGAIQQDNVLVRIETAWQIRLCVSASHRQTPGKNVSRALSSTDSGVHNLDPARSADLAGARYCIFIGEVEMNLFGQIDYAHWEKVLAPQMMQMPQLLAVYIFELPFYCGFCFVKFLLNPWIKHISILSFHTEMNSKYRSIIELRAITYKCCCEC